MMTTVPELERQASAARHALNASLTQLRTRTTPRALGQEIRDNVQARLSSTSRTLTEHAATPGGLIAVCALAFGSAFAAAGALRKEPVFLTDVVEESPRRFERRDHGQIARMLIQLSGAIAAGVVASRYLPQTEFERNLVADVGPELRETAQKIIEAKARQLVTPKSAKYGPLNLVALAGAFLLSRNTSGA